MQALRRRAMRWSLAIAALALLGGVVFAIARTSLGPQPDERPPVLLFTTLPILWDESESIEQALTTPGAAHWALPVLDEAGPVRALDELATDQGRPAIGRGRLLVLAQPRVLSAAENVALDDWVRSGGRVLLFADPMLTAHSKFPIGDRRRPQDIVLLSPILTRWGLGLQFDEAQPGGERLADLLGAAAPVNLAGRFVPAGGGHACAIASGGLVARCRIGRGSIVAVADAAVLESGAGADEGIRVAALRRLLREIAE